MSITLLKRVCAEAHKIIYYQTLRFSACGIFKQHVAHRKENLTVGEYGFHGIQGG